MSPSAKRATSPSDSVPLPRARERRQQRSILPESPSDRIYWLEALGHTITPSYDFILSSLLSGLILAAAYLLQSSALLVLGILFSPFLGPVLGISLSIATGSIKFLTKAVLSLMLAGVFIFGFGALAGALAPIIDKTPLAAVTHWSSYHWTNFLVVAVGAILSIYMLARSPRQKPLVPSIAIAYGLLPPLAASGFNLTAVSGPEWLAPLTTTGVHLVWAILTGIVMFILVGQSPRTLSGYLLSALMLGLLAAAFLTSDNVKNFEAPITPTQPAVVLNATLTPTPTASSQAELPTPVSSTPQSAVSISETPTSTATSPSMPTMTITPQPTPIWARVSAPTGGGAYLRDEPDGRILSSILNGNMLEVISEPVYGKNGVIWVQVRTEDGFTGWMVQSLLATATPSAGW